MLLAQETAIVDCVLESDGGELQQFERDQCAD